MTLQNFIQVIKHSIPLPIKSLFAIIHTIWVSGLLYITLFSNNIRYLTGILIVCILTRAAYLYFDGCYLSYLEEHPDYLTMAQTATYIMSNEKCLDARSIEIITINAGIFLSVFKILMIIIANQKLFKFITL